jgi:ABC-type nitrate/sulfonate/bicarbonate transport system ATPase subunit
VRDDAAFVFQNYSRCRFSALERAAAVQAAFPNETADEQKRRASQALERVGLNALLDRAPAARRHVASACAARGICHRNRALFLDEPFGALDADARRAAAGPGAALRRLSGR